MSEPENARIVNQTLYFEINGETKFVILPAAKGWSEFIKPVRDVVNAWMNPGKVPAYHYMMRNNLKKKWPVLHNTLVRLINSQVGMS